ncbi:MAG TPA: HD domain-containing protein [Candidatus Paceibacterota bacterium]|nr:HD domain-containing protein [Candidatus Paceibacterota bacterium]
MKFNIPVEVLTIIQQLQKNNFEAYLVGGCVRDLLLKKEPKDWDIATQAKPEEIQRIFPESIYENAFGTVGIKTSSEQENLKIIEATTFRKEGKYTDKRHPDYVVFAETIEEDLSRRDFTINALALKIDFQENLKNRFRIIDPFNGQKDLRDKIIRTVGNPEERFQEDALRLMRAIRLAVELNFKIEEKTFSAIQKMASLLQQIAPERIRDEFVKIILTPLAAEGILLLHEANLLKQFLPELEEGVGVGQNKHHVYSVFEHLWRSLDYAARNNYSLEVRLAALFHDLGKPRTKEGEGPNSTFYNHEMESTKMVYNLMARLRFDKKTIKKVIKLVRYHGFVYDPEITTDSSIRRLILKVGKENIFELAKLREADRIGSGCPKAKPFRLRHFLFRVEKILKEMAGEQPSLKMLKINGNEIMKITNLQPGPKVGAILNILLEEILDDPLKNEKKYLEKRAKELSQLSDKELEEKQKMAKETYLDLLKEEEEQLKKKHQVV